MPPAEHVIAIDLLNPHAVPSALSEALDGIAMSGAGTRTRRRWLLFLVRVERHVEFMPKPIDHAEQNGGADTEDPGEIPHRSRPQ
jgi:hypothetical protein